MAEEVKIFAGAGLNQDDAPELLGANDLLDALNIRVTGVKNGEGGYVTNLPSTEQLTVTLPAGTNKVVGAEKFEDAHKAYIFRYNSLNRHTLSEFDYDTQQETILFTNINDSSFADILPLNANTIIKDIKLIDKKFLVFPNGNNEPCCINVERLKSGGYGTLTKSDFLLIKAQPIKLPTVAYNSDINRSANQVRGKLFQFRYQYIYLDDEPSTLSSISKRVAPEAEVTTENKIDVTKNNSLIVKVDAGSNRVKKVVIDARYDNLDWFTIKSIDRETITQLTNAEVNTGNFIYEAYSSATNTYSFTFYNDGLYSNRDVLESDMDYDHVPLEVETIEEANGVLLLGGITEGYDKVDTDVTLGVSYYDPVLIDPLPAETFKVKSATDLNNGVITILFGGTPKTGDKITVSLLERNTNTLFQKYEYTVPSGQNGLISNVLTSFSALISGSSVASVGADVRLTINTTKQLGAASVRPNRQNPLSYYTASMSSLKLNSMYQYGLVYYDEFGRYGKLQTGNDYIVKTKSYAQSQGLIPSVSWLINHTPPSWAKSYQWVRTKNNTHQSTLYATGATLNYKGTWNADTNTPTLTNAHQPYGTMYRVSKTGSKDIGQGNIEYKKDDYIFYNNTKWDVISGTDTDLADTDHIYFHLASLPNYNKKNAASILAYDYAVGDRCSLCYYMVSGVNTFFTNALDTDVVGYNAGSSILKIRKPANLDTAILENNNVMLELYSPKKRLNTEGNASEDSANVFYEIGERFDIANGQHAVTSGQFRDGDCYYKTRKYEDPVNATVIHMVEDFNYSDFYKSDYDSSGRAHIYTETKGRVSLSSCIRYSDSYNKLNQLNQLNRFYGERLYGEGAGELSSTHGGIKKLRQRGGILIAIQELIISYIPVNQSIVEDQAGQQQYAVSDTFLNKVRYSTGLKSGIGNAKESLSEDRNGNLYYIDPLMSEPVRAGIDGVTAISGKMSKFFKKFLREANQSGKKILGYYDNFNKEYILTVDGKTIAYNEDMNRWIFYSFVPEYAFSMFTDMYSFKGGMMYLHRNQNVSRNNFYGTQYASTLKMVFNKDANITKRFQSIKLRANQLLVTTIDGIQTSLGQVSELIDQDFLEDTLSDGVSEVKLYTDEGVYEASFLNDKLSEGGLIEGESLKGNYATLELTTTNNQELKLFTISVKYR